MSKKILAKRLLVTKGADAAQGGSSPLSAGSAEPRLQWHRRGCGDMLNCSEGTGERGFPQAGAMLRCRGVIKTTASEEEPSRGMGSGLLSAWRFLPLAECRAQQAARGERAAATLRRPSLGTLSCNKLFAWMRQDFPLAFNSQITLSLKRKASWGSEAAVNLSIVEQGTESEAPWFWELCCGGCFLSFPPPEHPRAEG